MPLTPQGARIFRVRKTCLKMLDKRGYVIPDEALDMTAEEFCEQHGENPTRDQMTILAEKMDSPEELIFVFFPQDEKKIGVPVIKDYMRKMEESKVTRAILVVRDDITPFAKSALKEVAAKLRIEYFKEAELLVDITEHNFVPKHEVLTPQQKSELLQR